VPWLPQGFDPGEPTYSAKSNVPEGRCDRSLARSAWDNANPKSRPVGYGMIRARCGHRFDMAHISTRIPEYLCKLAAPDHAVPYGTVHLRDTFPGTSCLATIGVVPTGRGPTRGLGSFKCPNFRVKRLASSSIVLVLVIDSLDFTQKRPFMVLVFSQFDALFDHQ
jgi:hypothetical protein